MDLSGEWKNEDEKQCAIFQQGEVLLLVSGTHDKPVNNLGEIFAVGYFVTPNSIEVPVFGWQGHIERDNTQIRFTPKTGGGEHIWTKKRH